MMCFGFFKRLSGWFVWWCFFKMDFLDDLFGVFPQIPWNYLLSYGWWLMTIYGFEGAWFVFLFSDGVVFSFLRVVVVLFLTTWSWSFFFGGWLWGLMVVFLRAVAVLVLLGINGVHGGTRIRMWVAEFKSMCSPVSNTLDFLIVTLPLLLAGPWFFPGVPNRQTPIPFWWTFQNFTFHNQSSISG